MSVSEKKKNIVAEHELFEQQIREHFADRVLSVKQIAGIIWKWIRDNDAVDKSCKITLSPEEDLEYIAKVIHKEAQKKNMGDK